MSSNFDIAKAVENAFQNHAIVDVHTHLYPHQMGPLYLAGPDELSRAERRLIEREEGWILGAGTFDR